MVTYATAPSWQLTNTASAAASLLVFVAAALVIALLHFRRRQSHGAALHYAPFTAGTTALCVDCHCESGPSLTHHRGSGTPAALRADTSTEIVLNAVAARHPLLAAAGGGGVSCNHFDGDGLGALFAAVAPVDAQRRRELLIECARVSDFRELGDLAQVVPRAALAWCVWVNSIERSLFWRPFEKMGAADGGSEARDCAAKFDYFLPRCRAGLDEAVAVASAGMPSSLKGASYDTLRRDAPAEFDAELAKVVGDVNALAAQPGGGVQLHPLLGLAVVTAPHALHYYALFGPTRGLDTVVTIMPGGRFEVECKYVGYVQLSSRRVLPRLALAPLAAVLTSAERLLSGNGNGGGEWVADRFVDSGPLLRLQPADGTRLTRAQRFGNPYERTISPSVIPPAAFTAVVLSFFEHGLLGVEPRDMWTWSDLHDFNAGIDWAGWAARASKQLLLTRRE